MKTLTGRVFERALTRRANRFALWAGVALSLVGCRFPTFAQESFAHAKAMPRTERIIVQPRQDIDPAEFEKWSQSQPLDTVRVHSRLDNLHVMLPRSGMGQAEMIERLQASGLIEFAEPDYILSASIIPNDPDYLNGTLWGLNSAQSSSIDPDINAPEAWDLVRYASNVVVAVIDSGIRATHEDLRDNLWTNPNEIAGNGLDDDKDGIVDDVHGYNAINNTGDVTDSGGHGTHVAGIIGASGNNGKGSTGVAWTVRLMSLKFLDADGQGATSDAIACIDYARAHGAQIINASWGGAGQSQSLRRAIDRARASGIIFVSAAGNESSDDDRTPSYPASYALDNLVSVAASDSLGALASFSNYGAVSVDLMAPGVSILSTWHTSDSAYVKQSGTSMSTPFVTGVFALLKARFPSKDYKTLIAAVFNSVDKVASATGKTVTGGKLNARAAIKYLMPIVSPALTLSSASGGWLLNLTAEAETGYTVQESADLATWSKGASFVTDSDGHGATSITNLAGARFFRAQQE